MGARRQVVVLGSGAAGMAAALAAATNRADVTVLERAPLLGGTTAISGGGIWIPANPWAAAAGGDDDIDSALAYVRALQMGDVDPALAEAYVRDGVDVAQALEQHAGVQWQHLVGMGDYHAEQPGGSRHGRSLEIAPVEASRAALARVRPDPYGTPPWTINEEAGLPERPADGELERRRRQRVVTRGRGLVAACYDALAALDVDVRTSVGPPSLVTTRAAVTGVEVDGEQLDGAVVIATGGFERDRQLVAAFLRGPILAPAGPPTNAGEGLRMGMAAGAALGNMSEAWWCPGVQVDGERIDGAPFARMLFLDLARPGGIVVDRHGRRFGNEATNYNDFGRLLHDVDGADFDRPRIPSWFVFDAVRHRQFPIGFQNAPEPDGAWLLRAGSLDALAAAMGLPAATLAETIETFNDGVAKDADAFGRGTYLWDSFSSGGGDARPIEGPPYYAARVLPGCLGTKGGLRTDRHGRVRRAADDNVIDGLFAAGNAAANPFGCAYPGPGATIGPAVVFGWRAGEAAAS
jgi:succinate dehydrogenase/fumarate reductase flavoprotein subunit